MALTFVGSKTGAGTGATYSVDLTGLTGGVGTAAKAGDLVICLVGSGSSADLAIGVSSPGDYTELVELVGSDSRVSNFSVNWKLMGPTPDTSVTVVGENNSANGGAAVVFVLRGADRITPIDVATTSITGTNGALPDPPAITPITPGAWIVVCGVGTGDSTPVAQTVPSGYGNAVSVLGTGSTRSAVTSIASKAWTSGAENPAAWTGGETTVSDAWCAATIAIRPMPTIVINNYLFAKVGDGMSTSEKIR